CQARSLLLLLHKAAYLAARLCLDLRAHSPSIQNRCCHARSATSVVIRWVPTIMPASDPASHEFNTSTRCASLIVCTLRRPIQQAPIAGRKKSFVHEVLTGQMIALICSKEIEPHLLQFFLPIGLQWLLCFIFLPGVTLLLQEVRVARAAGKLLC